MGSVCALLLTQPANPAEQDWDTTYSTDPHELPKTVVGLNKMLSRDALPSECVQDSAEPCLAMDFLLAGDIPQLPCDLL